MNGPGGEALGDATATFRAALLEDSGLVRGTLSGRQRNMAPSFRRVEIRYVDLKAGRRLQVTSYDDTRATARNIEPGAPAAVEIDSLLAAGYANWQVDTVTETLQVRVSKKGRPLIHRAAKGSATAPDLSHDRTKRRRLDESDELFAALGIATPEGRIKPTRTAKYRQVQDFLSALDPLVGHLAMTRGETDEPPVRVVDLGCGNAYLTFAAFRYLGTVKRLPVHMLGVDISASARSHNTEVARRLGVEASMDFIGGAIADVEVDPRPDLVLALHACDTATDDALARAVRWQAPVILAAPCCHHDIQRQLAGVEAPAAYRLVTRHAILRERFADVLTDALRAAILRMVGYRVEVVEFVDSQHTPRNALIRGVRTGSRPSDETVAAYLSLVRDWGVRPALAQLLVDEHPALTDGGSALSSDTGDAGR